MSSPYDDCLVKVGLCDIKKPPTDAVVLVPFVKLDIKHGITMTVGNESSPLTKPYKHTAVISNFEYGANDAMIAKITIHDQEGSSFVKFVESLVKDLNNTSNPEVEAVLDFGWIKLNCENIVNMERLNAPYYGIIRAIDCNFQDGRVIYEIEVTDRMNPHAEARIAATKGERGDPTKEVPITDAIRDILTDKSFPPSVAKVSFHKITFENNAYRVDDIIWKYHDGDEKKGPKGVWRTNGLDKLNAVKQWLSNELSNEDKNFIITYVPTTPGGEIRILEDPQQACSNFKIPANCALKYVVHGGQDSSVISFNPQFRFVWSNLASVGGVMGSGNVSSNSEGSKSTGHDCVTLSREYIKSGGVQITSAANENAQFKFSKQEQDIITARAQKKQLFAYAIDGIEAPIKADLVIVGDPKLDTVFFKKQFVGIVFINPYHLLPEPNSDCGEWIATPLCNEVLTNANWIVEGVNHLITADGKFTTTLKLELQAPGVNLEVGAGFGGNGWVPPPI